MWRAEERIAVNRGSGGDKGVVCVIAAEFGEGVREEPGEGKPGGRISLGSYVLLCVE